MRFVRGQYAAGLPVAGMLGYVFDGRIDKAISNVDTQIRERGAKLKALDSPGLLPSSVRPVATCVRETRHQMGTYQLLVHHLFLSVQSGPGPIGAGPAKPQ